MAGSVAAPAPRRTIPTGAPAGAAPVAPVAPALEVAATTGVAAYQPLVLETNVGTGYSDGPLASLTAKQREANRAVNGWLVARGALPAEYATREDFSPATNKALWRIERAAKNTLPSYANGAVEGSDENSARTFIKAAPRRSDNTRPEQPGSTLAMMNDAGRANLVLSADGESLVPASVAAPVTPAPTPAPVTGGPAPTPSPTPTPVTGDPAPVPAPGAPAAGPDRHIFSTNPNDTEYWVTDMRAALGIDFVDNRPRIAEIDAELKQLNNGTPSAENAQRIKDLCKEKQELMDAQGTQPGKEGIMGGVHAFQEGRGFEGVGEIISGGIQTIPAAVMTASAAVTHGGGMLRDWARTERANLMREGHGEINGASSLGLYVAEYVGVILDFAFNIDNAKWYQWLLPTMWASGALWLLGKIGVAVGHGIGTVFEAIFDFFQWIANKVKGSGSDQNTDQKVTLTRQLEATRTEIQRVNGLANKTAAQQAYAQALSDLLDARERLECMINPEGAAADTAMRIPAAERARYATMPDSLKNEQRNSVEAWRSYADSLRHDAGAPASDATNVKVTVVAASASASASTAPAVSPRPPATPPAPRATAPASNPPPPNPAAA